MLVILFAYIYPKLDRLKIALNFASAMLRFLPKSGAWFCQANTHLQSSGQALLEMRVEGQGLNHG